MVEMNGQEVLLLDDGAIDRLAVAVVEGAARGAGRRYLVGIAGIGGGGKSTLARRVVEEVDRRRPGSVRLAPMDGFHYMNSELERRGLRDRKGTPQTFDAEAYIDLLRRAKDRRENVAFPVYDRDRHEPAWPHDAAHTLDGATRVVVTEGNYLLLAEPPWKALAGILDTCWLLETPMERARQWIIERHVRGGRPLQEAEAYYERVDKANAELVLEKSRRPDLRLRWP